MIIAWWPFWLFWWNDDDDERKDYPTGPATCPECKKKFDAYYKYQAHWQIVHWSKAVDEALKERRGGPDV